MAELLPKCRFTDVAAVHEIMYRNNDISSDSSSTNLYSPQFIARRLNSARLELAMQIYWLSRARHHTVGSVPLNNNHHFSPSLPLQIERGSESDVSLDQSNCWNQQNQPMSFRPCSQAARSERQHPKIQSIVPSLNLVSNSVFPMLFAA